ncbi:zinc ribbon domain-containing protein YjdM [Akkermansiaceae bacterium]|nr:zinc ribbon domain-containing protein YjdM [Akkermansiaceae bacterium]MDB4287851.1 zinc ribbon domain-containing protein YjdM [bacterium]MDB4259973.1 zinc ribbon domain-containing protein YjdM [Akkermansiaceae bacterium]MDB4265691.1 zinc ribbon domain-containing protein YjdM [Akkermansiaceae bacterium]MDB4274798.1 zinc ribbon domain-containing protein YjdM [Akkermansiaceae bacterium]
MSDIPNCPECQSEYTYENGPLFNCPDCGHEWSAEEAAAEAEAAITRDAHGNPLESGDSVQLTKDLKVKGTSTTLKIGTKVKNIRLSLGADHDIDCKVDGIGPMKLKSQFVKKI